MQVKFNDVTALDVLAINGQSVYFQGAQRDSLEIQVDKSKITFDALDALTGDAAKTVKLTILDGEHQYEHDNYSIRTELALKPVEVTQATADSPAVTENRLCATLAQKTYQEQQVEELQNAIDVLTLSALGAK